MRAVSTHIHKTWGSKCLGSGTVGVAEHCMSSTRGPPFLHHTELIGSGYFCDKFASVAFPARYKRQGSSLTIKAMLPWERSMVDT